MNFRFHNTQWVPAHFHTYLLLVLVLIVLGFTAHFTQEIVNTAERKGISRLILALWLVGGYGFVMMFYLGGWHSVPRRYASYPREVAEGALYARTALLLILPLLIALAVYIWEVGKRWLAVRRALKNSL